MFSGRNRPFRAIPGPLFGLTTNSPYAFAPPPSVPPRDRYFSPSPTDGWDAIAYAEFVINAKGAPEIAAKGRFALEKLRAFDPAFVRAYLLGARLELQQNRYESAATLLDAAVALNPAHDAARRTLAWVQSVQQPEPDRLP